MTDSPTTPAKGFPFHDDTLAIYKALNLPEGAPIPGAIYGYRSGSGPVYMTCTAIQASHDGKWKATIATVIFGDAVVTESNLPSWVKDIWLITIPYKPVPLPQQNRAAAQSATPPPGQKAAK